MLINIDTRVVIAELKRSPNTFTHGKVVSKHPCLEKPKGSPAHLAILVGWDCCWGGDILGLHAIILNEIIENQ